MYDLLIIGGGPAGLSAAMTARNRNLSVCVICGGAADSALHKAGHVTNYPGVPDVSGPALLETMTQQARDLGADILRERALSAMPMGKTFGVSAGKEFAEGRALLLATGIAQRGTFPGETDYLGRGVSYCATCDGAFFRGKDVAIVGGGNTALEDALYLANVCRTVYLVHRRDAFRGEKALADRVRQKENIKIQYDSAVSKIRGESAVSSVLLENTKTGAQQELPVSAVFVAIGLIPENEIFSRQLPLDDNGYFVAGEDCKTLLEGVFVAGDCRSKLLRQIITAAADGAVAGYQAAAYVNGI